MEQIWGGRHRTKHASRNNRRKGIKRSADAEPNCNHGAVCLKRIDRRASSQSDITSNRYQQRRSPGTTARRNKLGESMDFNNGAFKDIKFPESETGGILGVKKKKPIEDFETKENLLACAREWEEKLFLKHWYIEYGLVDGEDIPGLGGESDVNWQGMSGAVSIRKRDQTPDCITRCPQELTLVHELLHFKYMSFKEPNPSIEGVFYNEEQHQLLEQMAKSLIMAKYDLSPEYFRKHSTF